MRALLSLPNITQWSLTTKLEDLDFADDVSLISNQFQHIQLKTSALFETVKLTGLERNTNKTKSLRVNTHNTVATMLNGDSIEDVNNFTYLGSVFQRMESPMRISRRDLEKADKFLQPQDQSGGAEISASKQNSEYTRQMSNQFFCMDRRLENRRRKPNMTNRSS